MTVGEILEKEMLSLAMEEETEMKGDDGDEMDEVGNKEDDLPVDDMFEGLDPLVLRLLSDLGLSGTTTKVTAEEMKIAWKNGKDLEYLLQIDAKYATQLAVLGRDGGAMKAVRKWSKSVVIECGLDTYRTRPRASIGRVSVFVLKRVGQ